MLYFSRWKRSPSGGHAARRPARACRTCFPQSASTGLPDWLPTQPIMLGLDLQGGSHILLEVDRQDLDRERLETPRDDVRTLLREAKIGYTGLIRHAAARCRCACATPATGRGHAEDCARRFRSRSPPRVRHRRRHD